MVREGMSANLYNIYPSLLDSYTRYLIAEETYDKIWGFSETPSMSLDEWKEKQLQEFLDTLNRRPFKSVYADLGTCYNDLVDMCIRWSWLGEDDWKSTLATEDGKVSGTLRGRDYIFPEDMITFLGDHYRGAVSQKFVEGEIATSFGPVRLYGFLDELMPFSVHDIKVTHKYEPWKFKSNTQHLVYPLCLYQMGESKPETFEYDIMEIRSNAPQLQKAGEDNHDPCVVQSWGYHNESYGFDYDTALEEVTKRCDSFIDWIEEHRHLIDNPKLFGGRSL